MKSKILILVLGFLVSYTGIQAQDWTLVGSTLDGENAADNLGYAVSLSSDGSIIAVSAIGYDSANGSDSGKVSVYQNVNGVWTQLGGDILGEHSADRIARSLSLSSDGSVVAIGNPDYGSGYIADWGRVQVYNNVNNTWIQVGQGIEGAGNLQHAGWSVSLSSDGSILAIGYPNGDNGNISNTGMVRVFQYDNATGYWTQMGQDIFGVAQGNNAGYSVDLSSDGSILAVGAPMGNNTPGYAQVYQFINGAWTQIGQDIVGAANWDDFGFSVSLNDDGSILAVGAPYHDGNNSNIGQVSIYQNLNGTWSQIGSIIGNETPSENLGWSVSLNSDGSIVAASAYHNLTNGHVRVYQNLNGVWTQIGSDMDGEPYDAFGKSISLSSDGSTVAVGAPNRRVSGFDYGRAWVFHAPAFITTQPVGQDNICPGGDASFTITGSFIDNYQWQESTDNGNTWTDITDGGIYSGANTPTLNITGVTLGMNHYQYHCIVSNSFGFTTSDTATLTTDNEAPVVPALQTLTGECSVTVTAPPTTTDNCAGTITGTTTDPLTYTQQGTYTINWTFDDGNGNTSTAQQTVIVADTTDPTITCTGNQTVDADQTHTYTVSGTEFDPVSTNDNCHVNSIYNDFNSASTLAGASLPEGTTTITWHITDDAGNESTCSFDVTVNAYVSVETLKQKGISIYPNPANNMLIVDFESFNGQEKIKTIKISDISGKIIHRYPITGNKVLQIDLTNLKNAVYFIQIETGKRNYTAKIVKE